MPEGDSVWHAARRLDALDGQVLTVSDFRVPSLATTDLVGRAVLETTTRGKHLLTRVEGGATIHTHLKMEGRWDVQVAGSAWHRPAHEARVVLGTDQVQAIGYSVLVDVVATDAEDSLVGHLGPDLLDPTWGAEHAATAVANLERLPHVSIGEALLDQRNLAGIGNVYRAEICFLMGLDPRNPVSSVTRLPRLVGLAHQLLDAHRDRTSRVTTGDKRPGRRLWVYGRVGPCLRCGTRIETGELGPPGQERATWWCPSCQPPAG